MTGTRFGYGQARYYWSLLSAVGIFVIGGLVALADGIRSLRHPEPVTGVPVGVAVLLVSAALGGWSWRTARRQLRDEAAHRNLDLTRHIVSSSDPSATTVFLEDSAALIGITLALAALTLGAVTGSAVPDGVASLLIGLLLVAVAFLRAGRPRRRARPDRPTAPRPAVAAGDLPSRDHARGVRDTVGRRRRAAMSSRPYRGLVMRRHDP